MREFSLGGEIGHASIISPRKYYRKYLALNYFFSTLMKSKWNSTINITSKYYKKALTLREVLAGIFIKSRIQWILNINPFIILMAPVNA